MKNYDVINELVPKTQELYKAIFDEGYKQGYQKALDDFVEKMKQSIVESRDWLCNQNKYYNMAEETKDFLQEK